MKKLLWFRKLGWYAEEVMLGDSPISTEDFPKEVIIKKNLYSVDWKVQRTHYDDHGHSYPASYWDAFVKCPMLNVPVSLHSLNPRTKVWVDCE